jgi:hypothetical protein
VAEPHPDGGRGRAAAPPVAGPGCQPRFEALNVSAADLCRGGDIFVMGGQVAGEVAQRGVGQGDAAGPHADRQLGEVAAHRPGQRRGEALQVLPAGGDPAAGDAPALGLVQDAHCGEGGLQPVQRRGQRVRQPAPPGPDRRGQGVTGSVEARPVQLPGRPPRDSRQPGEGGPLEVGLLA